MENRNAVPTSEVSKSPATVKAGIRGLYAADGTTDAFSSAITPFHFSLSLVFGIWPARLLKSAVRRV
jgi:hypothetical protein